MELSWLSKYVPHPETPPDRALPSEIQQPWGKVLVDPHWSQVQVYETSIPLWPTLLQPGWKFYINTKYKTPTNEAGLPWGQTMTAQAGDGYSTGRDLQGAALLELDQFPVGRRLAGGISTHGIDLVCTRGGPMGGAREQRQLLHGRFFRRYAL